jgi:hypothetical protein
MKAIANLSQVVFDDINKILIIIKYLFKIILSNNING